MTPSSNCCGAPSANEIFDNFGICNECREHAEFSAPCKDCDGEGSVIVGPRDGNEKLEPCPSCDGTGETGEIP